MLQSPLFSVFQIVLGLSIILGTAILYGTDVSLIFTR
jgi:hypothetical protein